MIHIIEGVPGSGKTYYAVKYLIDNFYKFDSFYNEYVENENKNVLVITNIDNFKPKHLNLDVLIERFTLEKFFTVENFEKVQKQYRVKNIVLIIDEAQRYFHRKFYNKDVFYFFQYHRHLGIDIFLITQSKNTISKEIVVLAEYIVRAVPRSLQFGSFRYKFFDTQGNLLFTKSLKKDDNVFNAYKSMNVEEVSKPRNVILPKIIFAIASFVFLFLSLPLILKYFWGSSVDTSQSSKVLNSDSSNGNSSISSPKVSNSISLNVSNVNSSNINSLKVSKKTKRGGVSLTPYRFDVLRVKYVPHRYYHNSICAGDYCLLFSSSYLDSRVRLYGSSDSYSDASVSERE